MKKQPNQEDWIDSILTSKKYRSLALPKETLRNLFEVELKNGYSVRDAEKIVRAKLHNIVAPYLGDPDYAGAAKKLDAVVETGKQGDWEGVCLEILAAHASTKERIPLLENFYARLFEVTGVPLVILDLACGLHPFSFPWMHLSNKVRYHAYDLHQPRLELINHFFKLMGMEELAEKKDVLIDPPQTVGDVAFFFKEAHRFEQRKRGCNLPFWKAIKTRWLLVSLPTNNLTGKRDLFDIQRNLMSGILKDTSWEIIEVKFESELVFCIHKEEG